MTRLASELVFLAFSDLLLRPTIIDSSSDNETDRTSPALAVIDIEKDRENQALASRYNELSLLHYHLRNGDSRAGWCVHCLPTIIAFMAVRSEQTSSGLLLSNVEKLGRLSSLNRKLVKATQCIFVGTPLESDDIHVF